MATIKRPLIFLPGILGSKIQAYKRAWGYEWWDAWPATASSWIEMTAFSGISQPKYQCRCVDILRQAEAGLSIPVKQVYSLTVDQLKSHQYTEGRNLFVFPYDFRYELDIISSSCWQISERKSLSSFIQEVKYKTGATEVDLLCHSMGGLVALNYLVSNPENINNVGRIVLLGSPLFGVAKAFVSLVCGAPPDEIYDYLAGLWSPTRKEWKNISKFFSSPYQLIPSRHLTEGIGSFVSINGQDQSYEQAHGKNPGDIINKDTIICKELLHSSYDWKNNFIANLQKYWNTLSLHLYFIQGTGVPTPVKYDIVYPPKIAYDDISPFAHVTKETDWSLGKDVRTITSDDGDGTVLNYGLKEVLGVDYEHIHQFQEIKHLDLATDQNVISYAVNAFFCV